MDKAEFENSTYIDEQGYRRWNKSHDRVHRTIAYKAIYLKEREKYPLEFKEYQVHHKDKNKENNRVENLELVHRAEHEKKHGIVRRERLEIAYMKIWVLGIFLILIANWLMDKVGIIGYRKAIGFATIFICCLIASLIVSNEKEGVKYI